MSTSTSTPTSTSSTSTTASNSTSGPHSAFFYGTLMAPTVLYRVIYGTPSPDPYQKAQTTSSPALLSDYQRRKVKYCDYPAITACSRGEVKGLLVRGLRERDLLRLDTFEGGQYERVVVRVRLLGEKGGAEGDGEGTERVKEGELVQAETYVWKPYAGELEEAEWDFEEFRREKIHRWDGLMDWEDDGFNDVDRLDQEESAEEARAKILKTQGQGQDPTGGRNVNGAIGKELETMRSAV